MNNGKTIAMYAGCLSAFTLQNKQEASTHLLWRTFVSNTKFDLMFCRQERTWANGVTNSSERTLK